MSCCTRETKYRDDIQGGYESDKYEITWRLCEEHRAELKKLKAQRAELDLQRKVVDRAISDVYSKVKETGRGFCVPGLQ